MAAPTKGPHYHALKATQRWAKYMAAIDEHATNVSGERAKVDRERQGETEYTRHQPKPAGDS